jgi:hypothetical protein
VKADGHAKEGQGFFLFLRVRRRQHEGNQQATTEEKDSYEKTSLNTRCAAWSKSGNGQSKTTIGVPEEPEVISEAKGWKGGELIENTKK